MPIIVYIGSNVNIFLKLFVYAGRPVKYNYNMKTIDARLFWNRFDELRNSLDLSLTQLCEMEPGLVYRTLTQQRTRNILPNVETLALLAGVLETSIDFLISGKETSDSITSLLKSNPTIKHLTLRLTKCDTQQLHCLNSLLDTWRIDRMPGEGLNRDAILA